MRAWRWALGTLAVGSLAVACGGGGSSAPPAANKVALGEQQPAAAQAAAQKPAAPAVMPRTPEPGPPLPPLAYEAKGRRDPFAPVQIQVAREKTGLEIGAVKLVGIISGSQPLALVETPEGLGYIVKPGDAFGNGHVTEVTASSVTFAIRGRAAQRGTSLTLTIGRD